MRRPIGSRLRQRRGGGDRRRAGDIACRKWDVQRGEVVGEQPPAIAIPRGSWPHRVLRRQQRDRARRGLLRAPRKSGCPNRSGTDPSGNSGAPNGISVSRALRSTCHAARASGSTLVRIFRPVRAPSGASQLGVATSTAAESWSILANCACASASVGAPTSATVSSPSRVVNRLSVVFARS